MLLQVMYTIATKEAPRLKDPKKWSPEFEDFIATCLQVTIHSSVHSLMSYLHHSFNVNVMLYSC